MISWLWNFIVGNFCQHKWNIIKETREDAYGIFIGVDQSKVTQYVLQCEKCGTLNRKRI